MRQIEILSSGPPDTLKLIKVETPTPRSGEVLIQNKAVGVNFADILIRKGMHPDSPEPPLVPGYEVAGTVVSVGDSCHNEWLGEDVMAITPSGGYSDYICVDASLLFKKPADISFELAASLPVVYLTAWQSLVVMGSLTSDETLLLHNAGGAFGLAAVEIAKDIGATVIGTASSHKHGFLKNKQVNHVIDYNISDWRTDVLNITDQKGVELIIDPIGGPHWKTSYECLRNTGRLGLFGISTALTAGKGRTLALLKTAMQMPFYHPIALMNSNKGVFGVSMQNLWGEPEKSQLWMSKILEKVLNGDYSPHIDKTFGLEDAAEAHQYIENRQNLGKVILVN